MSTFTLRYHAPPARVETIEAIFCYAGVDWKLEVPEWPEEQASQPAGKLPVLVETTAGGNTFVLGEIMAIEAYQANIFGLYCSSKPEMMARQVELRIQLNNLYELMAMYKMGNDTERKVVLPKFISTADAIVRYHEKVLEANGSNGHYFGDRTTYIDIILVAFFCAFNCVAAVMPQANEIFSLSKAPLMNKVFKTVSEDAKLSKFIATFDKNTVVN
ncbi:hypothetical protein J3B02_000016 [Coemansia erecta]|uniref:glutathione transferase n=1 Tax=Coemansia asiatica TaxID=1052880 RepID=A0A9W8CKJ0_9FUNG|nr:hypothetical protein LPJ64_002884 [Coemansia asiatica]KAJ2858637.1 hypothetical protein J3B02_000016 [Coemansia erecta]KAJ2887072.1 hypothetical protein FB639_001445 [Coemansia asiatica]